MTQLILPGFENAVLNNLKDSWEAPWLKQDTKIELPEQTVGSLCWLHGLAVCRYCNAKRFKQLKQT